MIKNNIKIKIIYCIVLSIVIFSIFFTYKSWEYQIDNSVKASNIYMQMLSKFDDKDMETVKLFGEKLILYYPNSPYASLAAFILSRNDIAHGNNNLALNRLKFIIKHSTNQNFRQLARIRAAKIFLFKQNFQDAINILKIVDSDIYHTEINEILGDIYLKNKNFNLARKYYTNNKNDLMVKIKTHYLDMIES